MGMGKWEFPYVFPIFPLGKGVSKGRRESVKRRGLAPWPKSPALKLHAPKVATENNICNIVSTSKIVWTNIDIFLISIVVAALDIALRSVESKHTFTRYIDTHNNKRYLSDNVGKCNRLDNYHCLIIITTHHVTTLPITHRGAMLNGKMGKT